MLKLTNYVRIARPDHWIKNGFILPGAVFAVVLVKQSVTWASIGRLAVALVATCAVASANYVINEWLDAGFDRFHPTKKTRAVVAQAVSGPMVALEYVILVAVGLGLAALINLPFILTELALLIMGLVYNVPPVRTKDIPYVDVLSESINNAIRLLLGWFALTPGWWPPASLLIGYWMGGAFLMGVKRFAEYRMIGDPAVAARYRQSFGRYTEATLLASSLFYAMASIFFAGVFLIKYRIELILFVPFLCGLYFIYVVLAYKEDSAVQKPEKLYRERGLLAYVLFLAVLFVVLVTVRIPPLTALLNASLVPVKS